MTSPAASGAPHEFSVGDHVRWNSEAGHVSGRIVKVHTSNFGFRGRTRHCSAEKPQYEIESDKTGRHAVHYGAVLEKIGG